MTYQVCTLTLIHEPAVCEMLRSAITANQSSTCTCAIHVCGGWNTQSCSQSNLSYEYM